MKQLLSPHNIRELLIFGSKEIDISISASDVDKILHYADLLREWNKKFNLTSISDPAQIIITHFLDSLTVLKVMQSTGEIRLIDIGTGAGFPGIVLRIMNPSLNLTLLDRNPKKIVFLKHVIQRLDLKGVTFLNTVLDNLLRAEDTSLYDVMVSRAFSSDDALWDRLSILLKSRGYLIHMGGPATLEKELSLTQFHVDSVWEGYLPFSSKFRRVTRYQKIS